MPLSTLLSPGRIIIVLGNLAYSIGAFIADYNETHVFNPRWPPHAKFHNGQTMTLGPLLAATSIYFAAQSSTTVADKRGSGGGSRKAVADRNLFAAAWIGSLYCAAGLSAIWYPGTAWIDPEFAVPGGPTQMPVFSAIVGMMWLGYGIERLRG